jgi:hypothetical protein
MAICFKPFTKVTVLYFDHAAAEALIWLGEG